MLPVGVFSFVFFSLYDLLGGHAALSRSVTRLASPHDARVTNATDNAGEHAAGRIVAGESDA